MTTPSSTPLDTEAIGKLAKAQSAAYQRMLELAGGVGKLGHHHPEMFEDMMAWDFATENEHADTVLALLAEVKRQAGLLARIAELPRFHMKRVQRGYSVEEFGRPLIEARALDAILNDESEAGK